MSAMYSGLPYFFGASVATFPDSRGATASTSMFSLERLVLPQDPIGNMSLTLTNIVIGSAYDIEVFSTGVSIASGVASNSSLVLNIPVYLGADPKNTLRIKIRKGSTSPYYQPYETQATALIGAQSIFINQLSDE